MDGKVPENYKSLDEKWQVAMKAMLSYCVIGFFKVK